MTLLASLLLGVTHAQVILQDILFVNVQLTYTCIQHAPAAANSSSTDLPLGVPVVPEV
jgi:hypothetical protein